MKRLTKTYSDGSFGVADDLPCGENSHEFKKLLIDTLGAFEEASEKNDSTEKTLCGSTRFKSDFLLV